MTDLYIMTEHEGSSTTTNPDDEFRRVQQRQQAQLAAEQERATGLAESLDFFGRNVGDAELGNTGKSLSALKWRRGTGSSSPSASASAGSALPSSSTTRNAGAATPSGVTCDGNRGSGTNDRSSAAAAAAARPRINHGKENNIQKSSSGKERIIPQSPNTKNITPPSTKNSNNKSLGAMFAKATISVLKNAETEKNWKGSRSRGKTKGRAPLGTLLADRKRNVRSLPDIC